MQHFVLDVCVQDLYVYIDVGILQLGWGEKRENHKFKCFAIYHI